MHYETIFDMIVFRDYFRVSLNTKMFDFMVLFSLRNFFPKM
jgi:hypothetical protein